MYIWVNAIMAVNVEKDLIINFGQHIRIQWVLLNIFRFFILLSILKLWCPYVIEVMAGFKIFSYSSISLAKTNDAFYVHEIWNVKINKQKCEKIV